MQPKRFFTRFFASTIIAFVMMPFITLIMPQKIADYFFNEMSLQIVYKLVTQNCNSDSSRVMALNRYVTQNIEPFTSGMKSQTNFPFQILIEGIAYCDQHANVLLSLVEKGGIQGNLIFLRGFDSISHHSVCEIYFDGGYKMFDPIFRTTFQNKKNQLASISEIQDRAIIYPQNLNGLPPNYFQFFEKTYPYQICKSNELPFYRTVIAKFTSVWLLCFQNTLRPIYYDTYIKKNGKYYNKKNRIKMLLSDSLI